MLLPNLVKPRLKFDMGIFGVTDAEVVYSSRFKL